MLTSFGQRLPVPFRRLFLCRQVFFQGFEHLAFGHALGLIAGIAFRRRRSPAPRKSRASNSTASSLPAQLGERLGAVVLVEELVEIMLDLLVDHLQDQLLAIGAVEDVLAVAVDALPLLVHHLVVFEQVFADFEVAFLDLLLRPSMRRETMWLSIASPSFMPSRVRMFLTHSPAKIRIRSSSSER